METTITEQTGRAADWSSLDNARRMGLDYAPATDAGRAFCEALAATLAALEADRRYQRRGKRKRHFELAAGAVAADLLRAARTDARRWSSRSLMANSFTDAPVSYADFKSVVNAAEKGELVERHRGHYQRFDFGDGAIAGAGKVTRFRGLPALIAFAAERGLTPENVDEHFACQVPEPPKQVLVLRGSSLRQDGRKFKGRDLRYDRTAETDRLEGEVRKLNEFLADHEIGGGTHRGYRRIFNEGDKAPYQWNKGGRLYSIGEDSYQTLNKAQRLEMTINGGPVAEIDIRASYLTLLHGLIGAAFDPKERDPYQIGDLPRGVAKAWINMTIGYKGFHRRWPKSVIEDLIDDGIDLRKYPTNDIQETILAALPILRDWPKLALSVFDLMFLESEVIIDTMTELMGGHNLPCLSVHDSIIVPAHRVTLAQSILKKRYSEIADVTPYLTVRQA